MLKIYNTQTREKEAFKPIKNNEISIYVCGVTVYDLCHIGHGRTFVSFDVITRYFKFLGYKVKYVRNITDIDDKIINRANSLDIPYTELVNNMIQNMNEDFGSLNIQKPDIEPRATNYINEIIKTIEKLIESKHAYVRNGDVLFSTQSYKNYGDLSKQDLDQLQSNNSKNNIQEKESSLDFVLWKKAKPNEPKWNSPWGDGRPGWHIECSSMNHKELGDHFDIHGGGSDLLFPHHENEKAQSICAYSSPFVNYWMHSGMVMINKEKMSKSLNNFFTIRDVLKEYNKEVVRFFLISAQYRNSLNYSYENLDNAKASLITLYKALGDQKEISSIDKSYIESFKQAMDDDFNTPQAIAVLFSIAKAITKEDNQNKLETLQSTLLHIGNILGLFYQNSHEFLKNPTTTSIDLNIINEIIEKRNQARSEKNWTLADELRNKLDDLGIVIKDGSTTNWSFK
ncbi:MAG: cysteine--tRNA ligase [Psittacicella sp.]